MEGYRIGTWEGKERGERARVGRERNRGQWTTMSLSLVLMVPLMTWTSSTSSGKLSAIKDEIRDLGGRGNINTKYTKRRISQQHGALRGNWKRKEEANQVEEQKEREEEEEWYEKEEGAVILQQCSVRERSRFWVNICWLFMEDFMTALMKLVESWVNLCRKLLSMMVCLYIHGYYIHSYSIGMHIVLGGLYVFGVWVFILNCHDWFYF